MKILIGGVPFGRNNVGDEAILETVVLVLREACPGAQLTVSTDDGEATARKLGVRTVELFGFEPPYTETRLREEIRYHDVFFWAGATGLSDYPEIPCAILRYAQAQGKRTIVWNVGMNDELNPAKYRLLPGKKRTALKGMTALSLGLWDGVRFWEERAEARARRAIRDAIGGADLVVVRDAPSRAQVLSTGVTRAVVVGADTALLQPEEAQPQFNPGVERLLESGRPLLGLCVSAQRKIAGEDRLVDLLRRMVGDAGAGVLFIPMNPVTDAALMEGLREKLTPDIRAHTALLTGRREPAEVLALTRHLKVVASSRLHLLILSSIHHVPLIGISRGSKVDTFLEPFGLKAVGSVEACDFDRFFNEASRFLQPDAAYRETSERVRGEMLDRLEKARTLLAEALR